MKFSFIIPVYNEKKNISLLLEALKKLKKGKDDDFEIIVIDNGSTDETPTYLRNNEDIILLKEHTFKGSPYSCRNRGIEVAKYDWIVLLDASCIPDEQWLLHMSDFCKLKKPDLVAGDVKFRFNGKIPTVSELYDALWNIQMKLNVTQKSVAKTASLVVHKSVFSKIGMFPEGIRSGGDVKWTKKATDHGFRLDFLESAIVYKEARGFKELIRKQWRVSTNQFRLIQVNIFTVFRRLINVVIPVNPTIIISKISQSEYPKPRFLFLRLWVVAQIVKIVMEIGFVWGVIRSRKKYG